MIAFAFAALMVVGQSNRPAAYGSGYGSWGVRGGATLGHGNGAKAVIGGGGGSYWGGYGNFSLEGQFIFGVTRNLDIGIGARVPVWPLGLAPGVQFRARLLNKGRFQLAFDGSAYLSMYFAGPAYYYYGPNYYYYYGRGPDVVVVAPGAGPSTVYLGLSLEPGVMMSYFFRDNMELFFGAFLPISPSFAPYFGLNIGVVARVGFAYTFKRANIGVFGNVDLGPQFPVAGVPGVYVTIWGAFYAGAQFRF